MKVFTAVGLLGLSMFGSLLVVDAARADDSGAAYTSFAGYTLGQQDLSEVESRLGHSTLRHVGQSGDSEYSICYTLGTGSVTFRSGELGGPSHVLGGLAISAAPLSPSCARWPSSLARPAARLSALQLGMSRAAFTESVSAPITWHGNKADVSWLTHGSAKGKATDVLVTIEAVFGAGKLRSIEVWRTETT